MEIPLSGGSLTPTARVGETVRRTSAPWTPAVHSLLRHLEAAGFDGAPRALGFDDDGREVLGYIEGVAGFLDTGEIRPATLWSDQTLIEAARLLRRFHEATTSLVASPEARWQLVYPDPDRHEVICHNDFGPYNCIFLDGHPRAMIDFDTAGPGPRAWDVAYSAYRFVPLCAPESRRWPSVPASDDTGRRLRLFCDAYGLERRDGFVEVILERIEATRRMLIDGAASGNTGYQALLTEGGRLKELQRDREFVKDQREDLQRWIET
jgi:hypothetical protein